VSLRVLLVLRSDGTSRYGGDTRLARETLGALRTIGVDADLVETETPDPSGRDIVHIFNVGEPSKCELQMDACDAAAVPYVLSPIWLDLREFWGRGKAFEQTLKSTKNAADAEAKLCRLRTADNERLIGRFERSCMDRDLRTQHDLLRRARVLLPSSATEARDCMVRLGVRDVPMVVVPIAANLEPESAWQNERFGIVSVGRVETRKNQLTTLFGLRADDIPIDVIGLTIDRELVDSGLRWCPRAHFHGRLPREDVVQILGRAAIHAMPSWCETAGIASLEAAAAGAQIVVGDRGAEYEYFGEDAEYADPADPESIRSAVLRAVARPPRSRGDALDRRIRKITWRFSAEETLRAYRMALGDTPATSLPLEKVEQTVR
jgi:glycosyltransferase involved in cell wall biosynthesis